MVRLNFTIQNNERSKIKIKTTFIKNDLRYKTIKIIQKSKTEIK